jgi:Multicopper oxidase
MFPDNLGIWMFHCHIDDYMEAGMSLLYKVEPRRPAVVMIAHYRMKLSFKTQSTEVRLMKNILLGVLSTASHRKTSPRC